MVDAELVTRKIRLIVEELDFLKQFDDLDESDYLDQTIERMGIERSLELLITCLIDVISSPRQILRAMRLIH